MTDTCAVCGDELLVLPSGSREACCSDIDPRTGIKYQAYWSAHEPSQADVRAFRQLTGLDVKRRNVNGVNEYLYRGVA